MGRLGGYKHPPHLPPCLFFIASSSTSLSSPVLIISPPTIPRDCYVCCSLVPCAWSRHCGPGYGVWPTVAMHCILAACPRRSKTDIDTKNEQCQLSHALSNTTDQTPSSYSLFSSSAIQIGGLRLQTHAVQLGRGHAKRSSLMHL